MIHGELGRVYHDADVIFREGDDGDAMYVIQFGQVNITKKTTAGEAPIAVLGPGEVFGEMALFDKKPRSATASARGECRVLRVDRRKFFASMSRDPTLAFKILQSLSQRIRRLNEELAGQKHPPAAQP